MHMLAATYAVLNYYTEEHSYVLLLHQTGYDDGAVYIMDNMLASYSYIVELYPNYYVICKLDSYVGSCGLDWAVDH